MMSRDMVKIHQGVGAHVAYLQGQIAELYFSDLFSDTRLICRDCEWRVNLMATALCFPVLFSCASLHTAAQAIKAVLLPNYLLHKLQNLK